LTQNGYMQLCDYNRISIYKVGHLFTIMMLITSNMPENNSGIVEF